MQSPRQSKVLWGLKLLPPKAISRRTVLNPHQVPSQQGITRDPSCLRVRGWIRGQAIQALCGPLRKLMSKCTQPGGPAIWRRHGTETLPLDGEGREPLSQIRRALAWCLRGAGWAVWVITEREGEELVS